MSGALLEVEGLRTHFHTKAGVVRAVDGVTFNLKQGAQPTATTFTVALDKSAITSAMQDAVSKFNAMLKVYKDASGTGGALANDPSVRSIVSQVRAALAGTPAGLPTTATVTSTADLGLKTNRDGTLSLDATAFQAALSATAKTSQMSLLDYLR